VKLTLFPDGRNAADGSEEPFGQEDPTEAISERPGSPRTASVEYPRIKQGPSRRSKCGKLIAAGEGNAFDESHADATERSW
jgi:hypothetical protein